MHIICVLELCLKGRYPKHSVALLDFDDGYVPSIGYDHMPPSTAALVRMQASGDLIPSISGMDN